MINGTLRTTLLIVVFIYFVIILKFLKNKSLSLKYTLLWIFSGFVMGVLVCFPGLLTGMIRFLGIQTYMNGLYIFFLAFIIMILMSITSIVSRQNKKIRTLIQEIAIQDKRIRNLESIKKEDTYKNESESIIDSDNI